MITMHRQDPRFAATCSRFGVPCYGSSATATRGHSAPRFIVRSGFGGYTQVEEMIGGVTAAASDVTHSTAHAVAVGIATAVGAHLAIKLIDSLFGGSK